VALDMRVQFGRPPRPPGAPCVHVVVRLDGEAVSLLFDRVAEDWKDIGAKLEVVSFGIGWEPKSSR
jgi:hypothetical protein